MPKQITTITIDGDLLKKAKAMQINISGSLQEYLEKIIMQNENDLDGVNLELLNIEIVRLQNELNKVQTTLSSKMKLRETIHQKQEERNMQKLEEERQKIEEAKKCFNCGVVNENLKMHNFPVGLICNGCYQGSNGQQIKKWMQSSSNTDND